MTEKIKALKRHEKDKTQSQVHTQQKEKNMKVKSKKYEQWFAVKNSYSKSYLQVSKNKAWANDTRLQHFIAFVDLQAHKNRLQKKWKLEQKVPMTAVQS